VAVGTVIAWDAFSASRAGHDLDVQLGLGQVDNAGVFGSRVRVRKARLCADEGVPRVVMRDMHVNVGVSRQS